jgi:hypothetical protein
MGQHPVLGGEGQVFGSLIENQLDRCVTGFVKVDLAVLAYVKRRFDVLEKQMGQLFGLIQRMNATLEELKERGRAQAITAVLQGLTHYDQHERTSDPNLLRSANEKFLDGKVTIMQEIKMLKPDSILPEHEWVGELLFMLAVAESGINRCSPNVDNHPKDLLASVEHLSGLIDEAPSFIDVFPSRDVLEMESPGKVKRELKADLIQLRDKLASRESLIDGDDLQAIESSPSD